MDIKMRIQLNIQVRNPNGYGTLSKIADNTILPITWFEIVSFYFFNFLTSFLHIETIVVELIGLPWRVLSVNCVLYISVFYTDYVRKRRGEKPSKIKY